MIKSYDLFNCFKAFFNKLNGFSTLLVTDSSVASFKLLGKTSTPLIWVF